MPKVVARRIYYHSGCQQGPQEASDLIVIDSALSLTLASQVATAFQSLLTQIMVSKFSYFFQARAKGTKKKTSVKLFFFVRCGWTRQAGRGMEGGHGFFLSASFFSASIHLPPSFLCLPLSASLLLPRPPSSLCLHPSSCLVLHPPLLHPSSSVVLPLSVSLVVPIPRPSSLK